LGQLSQLRLGYRRNLRDCFLDFCGGLEKNFHHRNPVQRLRFNVFDIVDRGGERAFGQSDDSIADVLRSQA